MLWLPGGSGLLSKAVLNLVISLCRSLFILSLLASCENHSSSLSTKEWEWQKIMGRDEGQPQQRSPIYRAKVPLTWQRIDAALDESIVDSTKANCEFVIGIDEKTVRLVVHSFPSLKLEERIPPQAQVQRWQRQFDELDFHSLQIIPCAQGGFTGLFMSAEGLMKGSQTAVLAWSMQLASVHYIALQVKEGAKNPLRLRQRQSDYTIKAFGPTERLALHRKDIIAFAASFELIEDIPLR